MKLKRHIAFLCITTILLSFSACDIKMSNEDKTSSNSSSEEEVETDESSLNSEETKAPSDSAENITSSSTEAEEMEENSSKAEETNVPSDNAGDTLDVLNDLVAKDVEDTIAGLGDEYEQLKSEVDTYKKYLANTDRIENFYTKIYNVNYDLCVKMYEYSLRYAELIINSDKSNDDKYDDLDELLDNVYDDAGDDILDGIYDGVLEDMLDNYYDGILDDSDSASSYKEWMDTRSDEYGWWSDTRSDVYNDWSDMRSDVYGFWSDMRKEVWKDDIERAEKKIEDFRKDIEKMKGNE